MRAAAGLALLGGLVACGSDNHNPSVSIDAARSRVASLAAAASASAANSSPTTGAAGNGSTASGSASGGSASGSTSSGGAASATAAQSPYEDDAAVIAWRNWAEAAAQAVNTGADDNAALDALMTSDFAKQMPAVLGGQLGYQYAGPLPFRPVSVTVVSPIQRTVRMCLLLGGYATSKATGKTDPIKVLPLQGDTIYQQGQWLPEGLGTDTFSCDGAAVPTPSF